MLFRQQRPGLHGKPFTLYKFRTMTGARDAPGHLLPDAVLARLRPPAWKERLIGQWLQKAGLFNPNERKFSRLGYILFTTLLYDDARGLWRAMFPDRQWMQAQYKFQNTWWLPYYHIRRLANLAFRRLNT